MTKNDKKIEIITNTMFMPKHIIIKLQRKQKHKNSAYIQVNNANTKGYPWVSCWKSQKLKEK